jgi:hypothetical protein
MLDAGIPVTGFVSTRSATSSPHAASVFGTRTYATSNPPTSVAISTLSQRAVRWNMSVHAGLPFSTQWRAVRTTFGATSVPVHTSPPVPVESNAETATTDDVVVSTPPPMMAWASPAADTPAITKRVVRALRTRPP